MCIAKLQAMLKRFFNQECEESADSAAADSADSVADSVLEYINYLGQLYAGTSHC